MKLSQIKCNPDNPRLIKPDKFQKLVDSIKEFPKMMKLRPIVINIVSKITGSYSDAEKLEIKYINLHKKTILNFYNNPDSKHKVKNKAKI